MFEELRGKSVVVTGASSGIGAAVAQAFGALGARVAVHYNSNETGADSCVSAIERAGGEAFAVQADLSQPEGASRVVAAAVSRFGGIGILVNNAGSLLRRVVLADASPEDFHRVVDVNATSVYATCHAAIPVMRRQGKGNIINVTSIAARTGGAAGAGLYAASKAMVSTLTRALAKEEAANKIRVNAVSPGVIDTPFHDGISSPQQIEAARAMIPLGRIGTAEDCAGTFLYLACDRLSAYVTGQIIEVNGGQLMP